MSIKTVQDILSLVEQPSCYLGSEINAIKKDFDKVKLRIALAFPDLYAIGTSHFGMQILYHVLNRHKDIAAERVFAPGVDMAGYLNAANIPLTSLESQSPLIQFDIVGFSLLYELNYTNMLFMLDLAGIPFFARQRDLSYPLIIAGGPCTCNPEPVADFFDAMVVGDGEQVIMEMARAWIKWKTEGSGAKETLLSMWSMIEGVYIPQFFKPVYNESGFQTLLPRFKDHQTVKRAIVGDLDVAPFPDRPIIPFGKPVHDRLRLEVSRGCTRGCRFCQAGMIYRPVRERTVETLMALCDASLAATGYEDLSLLSLSTGDYSDIMVLMERIIQQCESRHIAVSFPSLRAGTLTPALMKLVKKVRKTGFTIAPEAGSQRLRDVINKNITENDIFATVKDALDNGWRVIKLYFMVGLPTETEQDLQAIVSLVKSLRKIRTEQKKNIKINVSIATFIPKPHTPFQWATQISLEESRTKIRWLKANLKMPGIQFKWQNPEASFLEGLWARGDRRLGRLLVGAYQKGCLFDGWSDKFQYRLWQESLADEQVDIGFFTTRQRDTGEPLPWDHIDSGVAKDFLKKEWEGALKGEYTTDCRNGECNVCGVCDFERIAPRVHTGGHESGNRPRPPDQPAEQIYNTLQVSYAKQGMAKFFGHLELGSIFLRAIRRAGIRVRFSEGFHPMPRISFADPLPVGLESQKETFCLEVSCDVTPAKIIAGLNEQLPEGLWVHDCQPAPVKSMRRASSASYLIIKKDGVFNEKELKYFQSRPEFSFSRTNRKGKTSRMDLKELVLNIELLAPDRLTMTLRTEPGKTIRPFEVMEKVFDLPSDKIRLNTVIKLRNV